MVDLETVVENPEITLEVKLRFEDMDGTLRQSAMIAQELVYETLRDNLSADVVSVYVERAE